MHHALTALAQAIRAATAAKADADIEDDIAIRDDAPLPIALLRSPAYRVLTKSAHLALALIAIELANGRDAVTHESFQRYGIPRDSVTHALAEIEALGLVTVQRRGGRNANAFARAERYRNIHSIQQARAIRDRARHFGITRRRKVERETARLARTRLLEQLAEALNAPASAPALAGLDDIGLKTLQAILEANANRMPVTYVALRQRVGCSPNKVSTALQTLTERGLIEIARGKRRNVYKVAPLPLQREYAST
jgi:Mn-dependent DtxR family transcriptional regulator